MRMSVSAFNSLRRWMCVPICVRPSTRFPTRARVNAMTAMASRSHGTIAARTSQGTPTTSRNATTEDAPAIAGIRHAIATATACA
jgi:hypothetical protein